jgi:hypothetical protein
MACSLSELEYGTHLSDLAMISLGSFGQKRLVLGELFGIRERNAINALERIVCSVTEEIRRRVLRKFVQRISSYVMESITRSDSPW